MSRATGIDLGTAFYQMAEKDGKELKFKTIRNAFVEMADSEEVENALKQNNWQFVKDGDKYYIIGDDAMQVANIFPGKVEIRRPMQDGVLNKNEDKKLVVLAEIIRSTLGETTEPNSWVCTCVSSESVDGSMNSTFHRQRIEAMFKRLGWEVKIIEEGHAVVLAERPSMIENGVEVPYSGIGLSCLIPGTKIYTKRGLLSIEDVEIGDEVITHKGRWKKINNVIVKDFDGVSTKIQLSGYVNNTDLYKFVDNHEIYVYRNNMWKWIGCEDVEEGDIVGEPILERDYNKGICSINICEKITNSNTYSKKRIEASSDVQRLVGYFLGDGHILKKSNNGIGFDFSESETKYAEDVQEILLKNFNKESTIIKDTEGGRIRLCCYSRGIASWFRNHCYDKNGSKIFPWDICRLTKSERINLLSGLIRSDGCISNGQITFSNTSTNLIILAKQLFSSLGHPASISFRGPRSHIRDNGEEINGKKDEWEVSSGAKTATESISDIIENINCENSKFIEKLFITDGFCCSRIQKIEHEEYVGKVYDLQVDDDHSFSGPFLTIHNCGGGRTNCVLAYKGLQVMGMSVCRGGDWLDQQVSEQTGVPISKVVAIKEKKLDFENIDFDDDVQFAYDAYYDAMITYVFKHFAEKFVAEKSSFSAPLDIIVAGGTSMPNGFCKKLEKIVRKLSLPFQIKEVRHARDPRNTVVEGLCINAEICRKKAEKGEANKA